ncbi:MAG TPA: vanadium-dependent haloperoxidase [Chitinophagaceae bacterium]|nr:vanadium-dependent haloperoxidase [Chitinophagaceae bacterium]
MNFKIPIILAQQRKPSTGLCWLLAICVVFFGCKNNTKPYHLANRDIRSAVAAMTEIMVHNITNPPLAARFFAYSCLAGYEVIAQNDASYAGMYGVLNQYPKISKPDTVQQADYQLAAMLAMLETAKKMQPSGKLLDSLQNNLLDSCRLNGMDEAVIQPSQRYALAIAKQILAYAKADGYNKISNLPRYTPQTGEAYWYPTPPGFLAAVEPYFNTVRPFTLDSVSQFLPPRPIAFNAAKHSSFLDLTEAVYKEGLSLSDEHRAIAAFWDCNPFAMQDEGHLQFGFKKISPGAHWLGITGIACEKANKDFNASMKLHMAVAVTLMDAFICCWDEKFRSNRIRPETAIRRYIDPSWTPLLQTPPFPEYLSGHSVISAASATILTHALGDHFAYTDSVEVSYGLPPRSFSSFKQAAEEAGISRFYGGIHFTDAISNGMDQGFKVGEWSYQKLFRR